MESLWEEIDRGRGVDRRLDHAAGQLRDNWQAMAADPTQARRLVERIALVLQGSLVVRHSPAEVADAFCATRLGGDWGRAFGTLPSGAKLAAIIERNTGDVAAA